MRECGGRLERLDGKGKRYIGGTVGRSSEAGVQLRKQQTKCSSLLRKSRFEVETETNCIFGDERLGGADRWRTWPR